MKHKLKCEKCGHETKPQKTEGFARRVLASHMWFAHGIRGKKYDTNKKHRMKTRKRPYVRRAKAEPQSAVLPITMDHCPSCGARFYMTKGDQ